MKQLSTEIATSLRGLWKMRFLVSKGMRENTLEQFAHSKYCNKVLREVKENAQPHSELVVQN